MLDQGARQIGFKRSWGCVDIPLVLINKIGARSHPFPLYIIIPRAKFTIVAAILRVLGIGGVRRHGLPFLINVFEPKLILFLRTLQAQYISKRSLVGPNRYLLLGLLLNSSSYLIYLIVETEFIWVLGSRIYEVGLHLVNIAEGWVGLGGWLRQNGIVVSVAQAVLVC